MITSRQLESRPLATAASRPRSLMARGIAIRLFVTCWIIYCLHVTTNVAREVYPALALADHFSFRVDEYAGLHPDLFESPGHGWHINANPGASMLAAIPYALLRPGVDRATKEINRRRQASGQTAPPAYDSPWPLARAFFQETWRRGLDVKLGLAAVLMQMFLMAPVSALAVTALFWFLRRATGSDRQALWLSILYAFGTPVFFRTGFLNHNLMVGHFAFLGFYLLWNPAACFGWSGRARAIAAGAAGGLCVLLDYSGLVMLAGLFLYAASERGSERKGAWYLCGVLFPLGLLLFYQWQSFGNPLYPSQHWMPAVLGSDVGYQGLGWPSWNQLLANLADYRYGLFVSCPILMAAFFAPWLRTWRRFLGVREKALLVLAPVGIWLFSSSVAYSQMQFNTGIRYMTAALPFLYLMAVPALLRIPVRAAWWLGAISVAQIWSMAMYRDVERGLGVLDPVIQMLVHGFTLPALTSFSRIGSESGGSAAPVSPLPLFALLAVLLYGLWSTRFSVDRKREEASLWN